MNKKIKNSLINITLICIMLIAAMGIPWYFSSQTAKQSNSESLQITQHIANTLDRYSIIKKGVNWTSALNDIVRKAAHFFEFTFVGLTVCIVLNLILRRPWLAALGSVVLSFLFAYVDEYHQQFVMGRSARWFDVGVDVTGAVISIILVTVIFYIFKLRRRISELERANLNNHTVHDSEIKKTS